MTASQIRNIGTVLLLLATRDPQSAAQIAAASGLSAAEAIRQIHRLTEQGFIVVGDSADAGVSVYRLNPKGTRTESPDPHQRILVVDDADALRNLMQLILEGAGYTVIVTAVEIDAVTLLNEVAFDLVITDSFSKRPGSAFVSAIDVLGAAGATPVALFSAHRLELEAAHAAGFADLVKKPFDLDVLERQVRTLLAR
ncbi:MAG TPA: response regulator [Dehalococcoidia bacterium]|nr:response regulator [Dehalococcoidia bacterium]